MISPSSCSLTKRNISLPRRKIFAQCQQPAEANASTSRSEQTTAQTSGNSAVQAQSPVPEQSAPTPIAPSQPSSGAIPPQQPPSDSFEQKGDLVLRVEQLEELNSPTTDSTMTLGKAMTFSGPGPEVMNGRAAMLGFFSAMLVELLSGDTIYQQVYNEITIIMTVVISVWTASMVPLYRGVRISRNSLFNFQNELINGRAAMIGFLAMLIFEGISGKPIFGL